MIAILAADLGGDLIGAKFLRGGDGPIHGSDAKAGGIYARGEDRSAAGVYDGESNGLFGPGVALAV